MATTRKQDLKRMVATLEAWAGQIADLQAKAHTAGAEQRLVMSGQIAALRQQRRAYEAQMADTQRRQCGGVQGHAARRRAHGRGVPQALRADSKPVRALDLSTMTTHGVSATTSRRRSRAARNIAVALAAAVTACLLVAFHYSEPRAGRWLPGHRLDDGRRVRP